MPVPKKHYHAIKSYIEENKPAAILVRVGCSGPANYEPVVCIQMPGKNKLFFRNITEEKVEPLLNGVFHNDINEDDLLGQSGSKGFEFWPGISFMHDLPFFARQKRMSSAIVDAMILRALRNILQGEVTALIVKTIRHYTFEEVCDIIERSGLRGRSGGGYPTGSQMETGA